MDRSRSRRMLWSLVGLLSLAIAAVSIGDVTGLLAQRGQKAEEPEVRMTFFNQTWKDVLERVATDTDSTLVVHDLPPGRFTRIDRKKYPRNQAVRLINRELEPEGFRVLEQGRYLVCLHDRRVRPKYPAPALVGRKPSPIRPANATDEDKSVTNAVHQANAASRESFETTIPITLEHASATPVAKSLHEAFGVRSRLEKAGPNNLPAFRLTLPPVVGPVASDEPRSLVVEIDVRGNRLITSGPVHETSALAGLVREVDGSPETANLQVLASDSPAGRIARRINPVRRALGPQTQATRIIGGDGPVGLFAQADVPMPGAGDPALPPDVPPGAVDPRLPPEGVPPVGPRDLPGIISNLKADVTIESLQQLGVLILRGNEADIAEVMKVINQIELLSRGTTPDILLLKLQNVDSEALAELLNDVYEQLDAQQTRGTNQRTVNIIPVVRPNAVLVIAPEAMMESIQGLASELDLPVDPQTEVQIFRLKSAVPDQVVTLVEDFYDDRGGLGTRIKITADARTNSVIVMARPNDLVEIDRLIKGIDRDRSRAVNQVRVFPLRNALATELAETMTDAIDNVLGGGAGGGGGNFAAAKSVVLEYLTINGPEARKFRSGLLTDVKISADARTNSLLVTAPAASIELVEALIARLDEPSASVAEIKVFGLENADATATRDLLETLFEQEDEGEIGVQLAGTDEAGSMLVPMRFSVDVRTNSVVAIGGADALRIVEAIILRLDGTDARQRKSTVVRLQNSPATEIALAINAFLESQRELASVDPELVSNVELLEREIIVVDEPVSNSLLISATPRYYDEIRAMVDELDAPPRQVVIQALLVEVVLDNTDELGVELGFQDSTLFDRSVTAAEDLLTLSTTNTAPNGVQTTTQNIVSQSAQPGFLFGNPNTPLGNNAFGVGADPGTVAPQGLSNFALGRVNGDLGYGGLVFSASSASVNVLVRALAARRNVHILSRPQIRTLDNLLAQIQVGQEVPIIQDVTVDDNSGRITPLLTPDEAGIILTVTPRVRDDGEIVMEVIAEKSQFNFGAGPPLFIDPATGQTTNSTVKDITTAQTTVSVPDGQTVVIGGMITKTDSTIERKVPWLGDVPIVGNLFRYDSTSKQRTELLIFLTPRVLDGPADSEVIKQIEAGRLHYIEEEAEAIHGPLFSVPAGPQPFTPLPGEDVYDQGPLPLPAEQDWERNVPTTTMPGVPAPPASPLPPGDLPQQPPSGDDFVPPGDNRTSLRMDRYGRGPSRVQ